MSEMARSQPESAPFDLSIFDQDVIWRDQRNDAHPLSEMTDQDRYELLYWLRSHDRFFYVQVLSRQLLSNWRPVALTLAAPEILFLSATEWLMSTVLAQALAGSNGDAKAGDEPE